MQHMCKHACDHYMMVTIKMTKFCDYMLHAFIFVSKLTHQHNLFYGQVFIEITGATNLEAHFFIYID